MKDNPDLLENTAGILELDRYRICRAGNGAAGIAVAAANRPDLILCDSIMPEGDGYEALRRLKENSATSEIPYVFISASVETKEVACALGRGGKRIPGNTVRGEGTVGCGERTYPAQFVGNRMSFSR